MKAEFTARSVELNVGFVDERNDFFRSGRRQVSAGFLGGESLRDDSHNNKDGKKVSKTDEDGAVVVGRHGECFCLKR